MLNDLLLKEFDFLRANVVLCVAGFIDGVEERRIGGLAGER